MKIALLPLSALLIGLLGCEYDPMGYAENRPELGDAVREYEQVVFGEGRLIYRVQGEDTILCQNVHEIVGWRGADEAAMECPDCSEDFTFFRRIEDNSCDFGVAQTFHAGITSLDNVLLDTANERGPWWDERGVRRVLRTTWVVHGFAGNDDETDPSRFWLARLGLFEVEEEDWPDAPEGVEWARVYQARDRYSYRLNLGGVAYSVTWQMDLQFAE